MAVGTIISAKNLAVGYQPLLLAVITFRNSESSPAQLFLSTHNLKTSDGGVVPSGITSFPYNGQAFEARILNQEIAATQALSETGIDITPTVQLQIADADKAIWTNYEKAYGFKGANLQLYFIFWNVGENDFSSDFRIIFNGVCGPANMSDSDLTVQAVSRLNMNQVNLPVIRIQRRCPWVFPNTEGKTLLEATAIHQTAADEPSSDTWHCGYSPLATGSNARGNLDPSGARYTKCNQTFSDCIDRMGDPSLNYTTYAPIEKDKAGRVTARFGGSQWDQPTRFQSRPFGQAPITGFNASNEGKYNDYVPMGAGTYWLDPVTLSLVGDGNFTRFEALLGLGEMQKVRTVVVNDIEVDKFASDAATQRQQIALQLHWVEATTGDRSGRCNGDTIYDRRGDPHGSQKVLSITVPRQLTPSSALPRVKVLMDGAKVRVYSDTVTYSETFTSNPAWHIMEYLIWSGWKYSELNIQTFIDAAAYYDEMIPYNGISGYVNVASDGVTVTQVGGNDFGTLVAGGSIYINGALKTISSVNSYTSLTISVSTGGALTNVPFISSGANQHARFRIGFGLGSNQRISGADLIRQIRTACRSNLTQSNGGLLELYPDKTLADQQPSAISGSNYNTSIRSKTASGATANGYVAMKVDNSVVLSETNGETSLRVETLDNRDLANRVSFPFYDEDNGYAPDSLTYVDSRDVMRVGNVVDGSMPVIGIPNFDQAKRIAATWLAKNLRGNPRGDTGGTYIVKFKTSFKALHLRIGHIIWIDLDQIGIDASLVTGAGASLTGFLARVTSVKPSTNFEVATITATYHNDDWYVDAFEQEGFQRVGNQYRNALLRPSFPWAPNHTAPISNDAFYGATELGFGILQKYSLGASNQPLPLIEVTGALPINIFAKDGMPAPGIGVQGTTSNSGGNFPGGRRYYVQACAFDSNGNITAPSDPSAPCIIDVPSGSNSNTITIPVVNWPKDATKGALFAGELRSRMSFQSEISITPPTNPASVTLTSYKQRSWGIPDVEFNSIGIRAKRCKHAGNIGTTVLSSTASTITIPVAFDNQLTPGQFDVSSGKYHHIMLLGLKGNGLPAGQRRRDIVTSTGSVSITNGSNAITGSGTSWNSGMVGKLIYVAAELSAVPTGLYGIITEVSSTTSLKISASVDMDSGSGLSYEIYTESEGGNQYLPIANWSIESNDGDTFTLAPGQDTTTLDRGDGTTGLQEGDVIVVTSRPSSIGTDSLGGYVEDINWVNALNPYYSSISMSDATNASPIVVETSSAHGFLDRQKVYISGVSGNTNANGVRYVVVVDDTHVELYSDAECTVAVGGNGTFGGSGSIRRQAEGLEVGALKGFELYCISGLGQGIYYKIKDNTQTRIYIEGEWVVTPDESSVFVVNHPSWELSTESNDINNSSRDTPVTFSLDTPNYSGQVLFVQSFTQDGGKNEAFRSLCPFRMIYVYGASSSGTTGLSSVHITLDGTLAIGTDLAPITKTNSDFRATAVQVELKTAPTGADLTVDIYLDTTLWMSLVIAAGDTFAAATSTQVDSAATITSGSNIRIDISTVGTTYPGADLSVTIYAN